MKKSGRRPAPLVQIDARVASDWLPALDPAEIMRRSGKEPDEWQARMLRSNSKRIIIAAARQNGKTEATAAKALHALLYQPESLALLVSASQKQASEVLRRLKSLFRPFADSFRVEAESVLAFELRNGSRCLSLPSDSAAVRGFAAASLIVVDEASRVGDTVWNALSPIVAVSGGTVVLLSSPAGRRGFFHAEFQDGGPEWQRYVVTADQCPRHSAEFLARELARMGPRTFAEEYQAAFVEDAEDARNPRVFAGKEALLDRVFGGPVAL